MRPEYGMMQGAMMGWMAFSMAVWTLLGVALLVLAIVATVRLWPKRTPTFRSSEPDTELRKRDER